ncbi:MAG TPA: glycosyltransferase family 2 protein [Candidatus Binatus sp.]|jgi:glycosyltransferase involved in cell wall biosynthesis|nr:glycosyltransferase family 2 protein [Candidatus Binatus sp.]
MHKNPINHIPYVLITPARNEEKHIEQLIQSMIAQTALPTRWVIVNDGSTDATASLVGPYLEKHPWIELVNLPAHRDRTFAAKVYAFNAGFEKVKSLEYEVIGNLDSDVSFDADYCEFLLNKFEEDPHLGVAGTIFREDGYSSATDSFEGQNHVAGGCQLFRRQCFEEIGGYVPNKAGGIDWIAVTTARMKGWTTRSFREKSFFHYRSLGTAERSLLASTFSYGEKDYYLGGHPLWEFFRVAYRVTRKPYLIGGIALYSGYLSAFLRRMNRAVSDELMRFHRKEQMSKLKIIFRSMFRLKRIDSFEIKPS